MDLLQEPDAVEEAIARSNMYKLLAKSFLYPTREVIKDIEQNKFLTIHDQDKLEPEFNRLFAHLGSAKCPPYETEFGYENVFQKTQAMADIAGFYHAYGLDVSSTNSERVDFLSTELEFMAFLMLQEAYAREHHEVEHREICVDTQQKFLRDHVGRWARLFSTIASQSTENQFYLEASALLKKFIQSEVSRLHVSVDEVSAPNKETRESPVPFGCEACVTGSSPGSSPEQEPPVSDHHTKII
ncbi:MAG: molecular chaperone TorD family protein [Ignavibacteriales bacterium]|nr:molecular chaperone TorD family protein [Ignavibacteriales bacterium]